VRKLLFIGLLLAGACRTRTVEVPARAPAPVSSPVANTPGAAAPRQALDAFLASVRGQDLQAMSLIWGNKDGPVRDSKVFSREEMEQRELYLIRCMRHDSFRVLGEHPAADNERVMQVELTRGTNTKVTDFFVAKGGDRWYVRSATLEPLKEFCSGR
jgi:hypothetical protein